MATVSTSQSVVATAEATIAQVQSQLASVQAAAQAKITSIVTTLQAHQAAHQKEVDAAAALIAKAVPTASSSATEAAAFVLTGASWTQGVVNFLGKNWRYGVLLAGVAVIAYAKFHLHIL